MRLGLILSILFHAGLLAFAVISFQNAKAFKPPVVASIPLDIVDISELSKVKAGLKKVKEQKELQKKDPKKPVAKKIEDKKKKKPAPKRRVEQAAEKPPQPKAEKVPAKKVKQKPKPKKVAKKPKPKPKPKAKPKLKKKKVTKKKKKKTKFSEDKIAALLNKVPDRPAGHSQLPDLPGAKKVKGDPKGLDRVSLMNIQGAVIRQVSPCWNTLAGGADAQNLIVKITVRLKRDGSIQGKPKVVNRSNNPFFKIAADRAERALYQCQPYNLPLKDYKGGWDFMTITFNPADMFR